MLLKFALYAGYLPLDNLTRGRHRVQQGPEVSKASDYIPGFV